MNRTKKEMELRINDLTGQVLRKTEELTTICGTFAFQMKVLETENDKLKNGIPEEIAEHVRRTKIRIEELTTDKQAMIEEVNTIKEVYEAYRACDEKIAVEYGKMKKDLQNAETVARVADMNVDRLLANRTIHIKLNERLRDKLTGMILCRNCWIDKAKKLKADVSSMRKEYFQLSDSVQEIDERLRAALADNKLLRDLITKISDEIDGIDS